MKNIISKTILVLFALVFVSSCQKQDVENSSNAVDNAYIINTYEAKDISSEIDETYAVADSSMIIKIKAKINMPNVVPVIVKVSPHYIKADEVEKMANVLFNGNPVYEYGTGETKKDIAIKIDQLEEWLKEADEGDEILNNYRKSLWNKWLEEYRLQYEIAGDTYNPLPADWTFKSPSEYNEYPIQIEGDSTLKEIKVFSNIGGQTATLDCNIGFSKEYILNHLVFWVQDGFQQNPIEEDVSDVENYINDKLVCLGMDKWSIQDCQLEYYETDGTEGNYFTEPGYYYKVRLEPIYEGINVLSLPQLYTNQYLSDYAYRYYYETLDIYYSSGGIVYFDWLSPLEQEEKIYLDMELLRINQVTSIGQKYFQRYTLDGLFSDAINEGYYPIRGEIIISNIEFGLARKRINKEQIGYYLIPAWIFRGDIGADDGSGMRYYYNSMNMKPQPLLVINACDGSIIDHANGF